MVLVKVGLQELVTLFEDPPMLEVDVGKDHRHQDETYAHRDSDNAINVVQVLRGIWLGHVLPIELHDHAQAAAGQEQWHRGQSPEDSEVAPGDNVLIQVVASCRLESYRTSGHQADDVVRLRHSNVRGDDVQEVHKGENDKSRQLDRCIDVVWPEPHGLLHVEKVVHGVLHHEPCHHPEATKCRQSQAQHAVLKEAGVVGNLHRLTSRQEPA
mmetsp:Transcript_68828/g.163979  ORF Transcript_68828/g.163979 Transcript_68828/m.163979 type:complete len:212 (-) Transcript_68828:165-800(-)